MKLDNLLKLNRCPHCSVDTPNLVASGQDKITHTDNGQNHRIWRFYTCARCGGVVTASANPNSREVTETFPQVMSVSEVLPVKVRAYLQQAIDSTFAPSGSIILCASAVDAILQEKGYKEGKLYTRIKEAIDSGLLTSDMGQWAHQVRIGANEERHADDNFELPTVEDAKQAVLFTQTLAELLFVLPSKVSKGIQATIINPIV